MAKTNIHNILVTAGTLAAVSGIGFMAHAATQIGTGSVTGTGGFDSSVMWNETFSSGAASGSVTGIQVKAKVLPLLNMELSTGTIDLGTLDPLQYKSGSLNIEIGTNAANGVVVTARSTEGGLRNQTNTGIIINNTASDSVIDNYQFSSSANADDSSYGTFVSNGNLAATEVINASTEHTIYQTNNPEQNTGVDDVVFTVAAKPDAQTAAGDYADVVTFTVTGNF